MDSGHILGTAVESSSEATNGAVLVSINPTYKISALSMGANLNAPSVAPEPSNYASNQEYADLTGRITNLEQLAYQNQNSVEETNQEMASISARLNTLEEFKNITLAPLAASSDFATVAEDLLVFGTGSFANANVLETLNVGSSMRVTSSTIDTIGENLSIQSLRQGKSGWQQWRLRFHHDSASSTDRAVPEN